MAACGVSISLSKKLFEQQKNAVTSSCEHVVKNLGDHVLLGEGLWMFGLDKVRDIG